MSSIAFDTHAFVKKLTAAGMPEAQAEVLAEEQARLIENRLATKRDIEELKRDVREVEMRLGRDLKIWTGTLAGVLFAALAAIRYFG